VLTNLGSRHIPLDALPDHFDVEVIYHTPLAGQPPSLIEDHPYPRPPLLAGTHCKGRASTNHVGILILRRLSEDGTDLTGPFAPFLEYIQQITGALAPRRASRHRCRMHCAGWVL